MESEHRDVELELFRVLINKSNDAIFINDPRTGLFISVNDRACTSLGYSREELLSMGVMDIETTFPDGSSWEEHVNEVKKSGALLLEGTHRRKDGATFPVEVNVSYALLDKKEYMIAVARNITRRKEMERKLKKSEERLFKAQRMAHVGNWEWNIATNELYWSDEVYRIYGRDPEEFTPSFETVKEAMHPDDLEPFMRAVNAALYEQKPFELDYRLIRPNGTERTVHTIGEVLYDEAGNPLIKSGTVQDITEYKRIEGELRSSSELIESILDTVDEAFIVIDADYRIILANNAYGKQAKMPVADIIGKHCYEISHQSRVPCYEAGEECAVRHCFEKGKPHGCVHRHYGKNGENIYVEAKAYPLRDFSGKITSAIEVVTNITDKHLLEEQILRTQKLEAVGTLAGGIAHDFNNLLQGVFGYISMAKISLDRKEKALAMLDQAEKALNMSVNLTTQLLTFSKGGKPMKKRIALQPVIENSAKFALSGSSSDCRINAERDLWHVEADEGQIGQVIQNIVLNANEAMPEGGTVEISAENVDTSKGDKRHLLNGGRFVKITIKDTGIGIPEQYLLKIFDPYFTTKQRGSGLGLATSYSIVRNHNGVLEVESHADRGSAFFIYLPASKAGEEEESRVPVTSAPRRGRILVMDDEEMVRTVAKAMLESLGHDVECAENGEEVIERFTEAINSGRPFDGVILDLTVKRGMGGEPTVRKLQEMAPDIRAIVSSGYSDNPVVSNYRSHGFTACLNKPYTIEALRDSLNILLG